MRLSLLMPVVIDLCDQAGAAVSGQIDPQPAQGPRQPCAPADGAEITGVPVTERTQRRIAVETPLDGARDIYALLLRNRCNALSGLSIPHIHSDRIADRKNIRMTGNRQIRFDFHSPRAVRV